MTLADLLLQAPNLSDADLKQFALILTPELNGALGEIQSSLGQRRHMAISVPLTDGSYMLQADLLTEIGPGGLYHAGFAAIPAELHAQVQVIPWAAALALLPAADPTAPPTPGTTPGETTTHQGITWIWQQARWPDGTFRADDPETPGDEAYEWVLQP